MKRLFAYMAGIAVVVGGCCESGITDKHSLASGIVLPDEWPPRDVPDDGARREMAVPYLEQKPSVIYMNQGRQLFVDDFLISEVSGMERVSHKADMHTGNPVLEPDREWEMTPEGSPYASPFSDGVWYDETDGLFKMWYLAGAGKLYRQRQSFYTCYAESTDGIHWTKGEYDIVPGTNVVDSCNRDAATIWINKQASDPSRRFMLFNVEKQSGRWVIVLKYSADGIHWSPGVAHSGPVGDRTTAFYNPFTNKWAISLRQSSLADGRSRGYLEHSDPEQAVSLAHQTYRSVKDRNIVLWFTPSDKELRNPDFPEVEPSIYNFDVMPYESIMLGLYAMWKGPENNVCAQLGIQKRNEIGLGYSRDGFHFYRPSYEPVMGVNQEEGAWNWGNMQSVMGTPLIVGDSLYIYASGRRLDSAYWDGYTSTGLGRLRRDGFVSMHTIGRGEIITEPVSFDGSHMFINAQAENIEVEVLDHKGRPIRGYDMAHCSTTGPINSTCHEITWKGRNLSRLAGKTVRFRFVITDGDIYSFWVSPWQTGESRGYTGGGGPGLNPSGIDIPLDFN